ncbi:uncharacterized protein VTP21DRAFT_2921 [Calcarisporiella thermophila]|uniref:uncharacterized protein n=1 Tax=Calcarisporiella thermophila TaxID=911321 RepID=UPI003742F75F
MNATLNAGDLNFIERQWVALYEGRNPAVVTAIVAFVTHEVAYFGRYVPFWIADYIPALQKYKLQPDKYPTREQWLKCLRGVLFLHIFVELPMVALTFHPLAEYLGMKITEVPLPSWQAICLQIAFFLVIEDAYNYWGHRALHTPYLYKHIHKVHHEYAAPFGMAAEYTSWMETLILGLGTMLGPLIYCSFANDFHLFTFLLWLIVRMAQAVDSHSGYDFPWSLHNFIPFWAGAEHHDYHHLAFVNNYGSQFRFWDYFCKTDTRYRAFRKQQRLEKELAKKNKKKL